LQSGPPHSGFKPSAKAIQLFTEIRENLKQAGLVQVNRADEWQADISETTWPEAEQWHPWMRHIPRKRKNAIR
jgi:hypothetical protein